MNNTLGIYLHPTTRANVCRLKVQANAPARGVVILVNSKCRLRNPLLWQPLEVKRNK